jgi:hypothetical protein
MEKVEALCNLYATGQGDWVSQVNEKIGAGGGTRTHDLGIMRPSLYP